MSKFSLLNVTRTNEAGEVSGYWLQNHIGTIETAKERALHIETVNGNKITVAVIDELPFPAILNFWENRTVVKAVCWTEVEHECQLLWERYVAIRDLEEKGTRLTIEEFKRMQSIADKYNVLANSVNTGGGMSDIEDRYDNQEPTPKHHLPEARGE